MKNHPKKLLFVAIIFLLVSCGKDKSSESISSNRVKTYTEQVSLQGSSYSNTFNIGYDGSERIISLISAASPGDKFLFNYHSADNYSMDLYNSNSIEIHEEFFLKNAYLDSTIQFTTSMDTLSEKYFYNAQNQLLKKLEYEYNKGPHLINTILYTSDPGGNIIKSTDTDDNVETFEYYPNLVYAMPAVFPFTNSKKQNLVKTHTITNNGILENKTESSYTFDGQNRIITIKEMVDDGTVVTKTFTYF